MSSSKFASIIVGTTLCVVVLAAISVASPLDQKSKLDPQYDQKFLNSDEWPLFGTNGSLFLAGTECGPDERLVHGALPTCEPTCSNPRPICTKIFFASLDVVPCFCKEPLVRNEQTKQCVPLSECPRPTIKIPIQKF